MHIERIKFLFNTLFCKKNHTFFYNIILVYLYMVTSRYLREAHPVTTLYIDLPNHRLMHVTNTCATINILYFNALL